MRKYFLKLSALTIALSSVSVFAATPIDLDHQKSSVLGSFMAAPHGASFAAGTTNLKETQRHADFNQTTHIRVQETYQGHPVWGADAVIHIPNAGNTNKSLMNAITPATTMNGTLYQHLENDLPVAPAKEQAEKALQNAISLYEHKIGAKPQIKNQQSQLIVYINKDNKAVWAYKVSFYVEPQNAKAMPVKPVYIMDAITFTVYSEWNDIQTLTDIDAGGFGGNEKMGKLVYDGLADHLPKLKMQRDDASNTCYLKNADVTVLNKSKGDSLIQFTCKNKDAEHGNIYWDADLDAVNHAYSPANDALYAGAVIQAMYQDWFNVPVLVRDDNQPMNLVMRVHDTDFMMSENAYWDGKQMTFGDGGSSLYPLTSLEIAAHEVSHGFTEQHANLTYENQSGGLNESFSDMAAKAAVYYSYGKVDKWDIGSEIFKMDAAIRYMDKPSKDCGPWGYPGWGCSVDRADQVWFWDRVDVHHSSGVFNHLFYILSTSKGWNVKKAFEVMTQANMSYWTSNTTFQAAGCGVIKATKDYAKQDAGYDVATVADALKQVALDAKKCS